MADKVTVITGASSGIGATLAEHLGRDGHRLVLAARREKELKEVAEKTGSKALPVVTDVTRREDIERLRDAALKEFGQIDVWVNNAGRGIAKEVVELTEEDLDAMLNVNLRSVFYAIQAVVPYFQGRGEGHMINISSFLGRVPIVSSRSAYNAAKAALIFLTANLRMNLQVTHPGVHVSTVMPGTTATDFAKNALGAKSPMPSRTGGPIQVQTAQEVATVIASLIDTPVPEIYTSPSLPDLARNYYENVAAFEEGIRQRALNR
jgi:NAD(P)-dependent dehydrogenase (short-subunit alcohol dehydrogenase family)